MSERELDSGFVDEITSDGLKIGILAELFFDSGTSRVWSGNFSLNVGEDTYQGGGHLVGMSPIGESRTAEAVGTKLSLSGVPDEVLSIALNEPSRRRAAKISIAVFDEDLDMIGSPQLFFSGLMDETEIDVQPDSSTVRIAVENELIDLERPNTVLYTDEEQKIDYPDDQGLEFVARLEDADIPWGREA